ncbi:sialate O-acetylesterase [Novipirellula sp. SH528]|uniref:sialate O-acetylesterase n=1 Tax=Novipirellula sp. SH528 TaxID=3454466 RepID=UPI003FA0CCA8
MKSKPIYLLLFVALFFTTPQLVNADEYDVYLLAGQSNMDGRGKMSELTAQQRQPFDNAIIFYRNLPKSSDGWQPLAPGFSIAPGYKGEVPSSTFGPELGFATEMLKSNPEHKLALIKGSKGGSSLRRDWNPGVQGEPKTQGQRYRDFVETIQLATKALKERGDRYTIRGLLWHQGESDSNLSSDDYEERLLQFVSRIRQDTGVPDLRVVVGEVFDNGKRDNVRAAIRAVGASGPGFGLVTCEGTATWDEGTHFDAASQWLLGQRYATAMQSIQTSNTPPANPSR